MVRTYSSQEFCPVARTLDIVGDRWTLLVLRDISLGHKRYNELLESCSGISTNLLSDRLKKLEERGFVERAFYSDHPPRAEYRLTEKGLDFGHVIQAMFRWGIKHEPRETDAQLLEAQRKT
ncbi:MAG TPA: helix-turn-helix domain-containing protein [Dehalococcoidia bacterium]|jgi:DNA-binding HxlR family transcriptional regulator|nr:helix-turn-helix domain-containing protein [Dehalococcoidia bacterium]